jgi:Rrf2 family protein
MGSFQLKRNGRLSLALHTLGHMAIDPDRVLTSADIAAHAGTNPVVVRRILGQLRKSGLLTSEKGHAGGWKLAHDPENITLADVYVALGERLVGFDRTSGEAECSVEKALQERVIGVLNDIEQTLIDRLNETTILDVRGSNK